MTRPSVWAPRAQKVELDTGGTREPMRPRGDGWHESEVELPDGSRYAFSLDGAEARPDPASRHQPDGVHAASAIALPWTGWTDAGWRGKDLGSSVLYELHVGTFTPGGTFDAVVERLDHLADLGVDAIELMPVAEFPGKRGWGYDGVDLYAAHHAYGGPRAFDRLVDACHARGIAVVLDVVYNHLGPDGNYLGAFGPYFSDRYRTPWGEAINFDGADSRPVREFVIENALMWLRDHHVDGLRLDAVHAIYDRSATHILEELTARVSDLGDRLGRSLWVIAESDLNDPTVVRPREEWGWGCDAQWSDDLHHALHTVLTGERNGYYADFGKLADVAKALRDVYVYDGRYSSFRRRVHGRPFGDLSGHRALAYSQDHDQVGNRAAGERLSQLVGTERLLIAAAVVLTSPFVPMLFMGEEWGAGTPFCYFTDHQDPALGRAVSQGRREEFSRFGWRPEDVADPQARETFDRSVLQWEERTRDPHRRVQEWYRALIALRRSEPALRDGRRDLVDVTFDEDAGWMRVARGPILMAFTLRGETVMGLEGSGAHLVLSSDPRVRLTDSSLSLPAESVAIVRRA